MAIDRRKYGLIVWLGVALGVGISGASSSQLRATIIDRQGNQHEVEKLTFQGRLEIEYYVEGQRRVVPLAEIDRLRLEGQPSDEQQSILVTLRTGRQETGAILTGASVAPHEDALGGGGMVSRFAGTTSLGPFLIRLSDVREVIMHHLESGPLPEKRLKATIITLDGKRFEVEGLRYRGKLRLDYNVGSKRRFVDLEKVARIDFGEGSLAEEWRPLTITYWSGKKVQGSIEASEVRLAGETDKSYYERVNAAFTGVTSTGAFAIGLRPIKEIRFHQAEGEETQEKKGERQESGTGEPATAEQP